MSDEKKKLTLTLLTNIAFIQQDNLRLDCAALLIEDGHDGLFGDKSFRVRGFGPDGAWPIFTLWLDPATTWQVAGKTDSGNPAVVLGEKEDKPLFAGNTLILSIGPEMKGYFLQIQDERYPLDVMDVTALGFPNLWDVLARKAEQYWTMPAMPRLMFQALPWRNRA